MPVLCRRPAVPELRPPLPPMPPIGGATSDEDRGEVEGA